MMLEKFNTSKSRDLEAIDLDKLNKLPEFVNHEQFWEAYSFSGVVEKVIDDLLLWINYLRCFN